MYITKMTTNMEYVQCSSMTKLSMYILSFTCIHIHRNVLKEMQIPNKKKKFVQPTRQDIK